MMHTPDHIDIILKSLSQEIDQIQERMQMQDVIIMQIIETLAAVGIISIEETDEEPEEESSIIKP